MQNPVRERIVKLREEIAACVPVASVLKGQQFPQPHRDIATTCSGLIHAEIFAGGSEIAGEAVLYRCDVCGLSI